VIVHGVRQALDRQPFKGSDFTYVCNASANGVTFSAVSRYSILTRLIFRAAESRCGKEYRDLLFDWF
jgi:hypothetical protein